MTRPRLLDLPHGYQTIIEEADWPLVEGLTLYRGTNGYCYFSKWENGRSVPRTLHGFLVPAGERVTPSRVTKSGRTTLGSRADVALVDGNHRRARTRKRPSTS